MAVGATVMSDTLSLVVFAVCVSIYTTGFSPSGLALLLAEIAGYIVLVLFGLSRVAAYVLKRVEDEEDAYFVLMLCIMAIAGVLADAIQLPGIVGAFLAGSGGQRIGARQAGERQAGVPRQVVVHSDFLYCHRLPDQPGHFRSGDHRQFPARRRHHCRFARGQMDRCLGRGPCLRLQPG